ncbi:hypothetical protein [Hymenobacter koreensis]|uniref:Uncharacterized protein n=1 Tax=Hymenobacter koreensis TaxID=1084523 RepID=A0ABP8JNC3_9BACT
MLRLNALAESLYGLVGWRLPAGDACLPELTTELTESRSGLYVTDLNELCALDVVAQLVPRGELLNAWLERITKDTLSKFAVRLAAEQSLTGPVLLKPTALLNGPGQAAHTVNPLGRFVGFRLDLRDRDGVTMLLQRLSLQLDSVTTEPLNLYLYRSDEPDPVRILPVQNTRANFPTWVTVEGEPLDVDFAAQAGVTAYLGYYEDDLGTARAIRKDFTGGTCGCTDDPYQSFKDHLWPRAISVPASALEADRTLFDTAAVVTEGSTFGLNVELTSYCDIVTALQSDENQRRVAEAVQLALGIRVLTAIVASPSLTQLTQRADVQADAYALLMNYQARLYGGKEQGTDNYHPSLLKNLTLDLSGLDVLCQAPKRDRVSVGYLTK